MGWWKTTSQPAWVGSFEVFKVLDADFGAPQIGRPFLLNQTVQPTSFWKNVEFLEVSTAQNHWFKL